MSDQTSDTDENRTVHTHVHLADAQPAETEELNDGADDTEGHVQSKKRGGDDIIDEHLKR